MIGQLVRIDLVEGSLGFVGWLTGVDDGWVRAEGRWLRRDGSMFAEQDLARPWEHVMGIRRFEGTATAT